MPRNFNFVVLFRIISLNFKYGNFMAAFYQSACVLRTLLDLQNLLHSEDHSQIPKK